MRTLLRTTLVALCLLSVTSCGKEADQGFKTVSSAPMRTAQVACDLEFRIVTTARDTYLGLNGELPKKVQDLMQILKNRPTYIQVEPDGSLGLTAKAKQLGCKLPSVDGGSSPSVTVP